MSGPPLARFAWRNLWRQPRRSLLVLLAIGFGGFLAFLMTAIQDRSFTDFVDTAARLGGGHLSIEDPGYLDDPSPARAVDAGPLLSLVREQPGVRAAVPRISGELLLSTAHDGFGAHLLAYDPALEDESTLSFVGGVSSGRMLRPGERGGAVLGRKLAENLDLRLGERLVYTLVDARGQLVSGLARLVGTVSTGAPGLDASLCLLPVDELRELLGLPPGGASQVAVFVEDWRDAPRLARRLGRELGPGVAVRSWQESQPELAAFVAMKIGGGEVMEAIVALLVAAGIFNALFMSVMERRWEFGLLLALGYEPAQLFRLVLWESLWLGLLGLGLAGLLAAWPYHYLSTHGLDMSGMMGGSTTEVGGVGFPTLLRAGIEPEHALVLAALLIGTTLLAGLYPAWRAARTEPVESLKIV